MDWTPWLIIGLGALLRILFLDIKPPHFDEGINGWFVDQMVKTGFYRYDPTNYHGPLHFYILFLSQTLFGRNVWALRMPVVLASIYCIWLTMKFAPFFGRNICRWAALAMAVSPGFVFYGRYSIHEVWLLLVLHAFHPRPARPVEIWDTRIPLVCRDGNCRDDPDQGDLHHSHWLRHRRRFLSPIFHIRSRGRRISRRLSKHGRGKTLFLLFAWDCSRSSSSTPAPSCIGMA